MMLNIILLSVIMLSVIMPNVIMLSVIMLSAIMLSVVASIQLVGKRQLGRLGRYTKISFVFIY
jgi:hypothetical protein